MGLVRSLIAHFAMSPQFIAAFVAGFALCFAPPLSLAAEAAIHISVPKPAVLSVGKKTIEVETLERELRAVGATAKTPIIVHLDSEARADFVRSVYSALRASGHTDIITQTRGTWFVDRLYSQ